jgi:copper chaperone CopZ
MTTVKYQIPNINCHHCVNTIKNELEEITGVKEVTGDVESKTIQVNFEAPATEETLKSLLNEFNYPVQ